MNARQLVFFYKLAFSYMTYDETINYLFNAAPLFQNVGAGAYKEGLSNTHLLDAHFNHPHNQFKTIHVAGTNGKGKDCALGYTLHLTWSTLESEYALMGR